MKKVLCIILSIVCLLSCFSIVAYAEEGECSHNYESTNVLPGCVTQGYTLHVCSKCGDFYKDNYKEPVGHSFGGWTVKTAATCTQEGLEERQCLVCKAFETKTVPVKDHVDKDSDGLCDVCDFEMEVKTGFAPFDWIVAFFKAVVEWFKGIFA